MKSTKLPLGLLRLTLERTTCVCLVSFFSPYKVRSYFLHEIVPTIRLSCFFCGLRGLYASTIFRKTLVEILVSYQEALRNRKTRKRSYFGKSYDIGFGIFSQQSNVWQLHRKICTRARETVMLSNSSAPVSKPR